MKKVAFVIPYFGKFNNYFELFLQSCRFNETIDFLIFTDDKTKYDYPENVKVKYMTFSELKEKIQSKFDFKIGLEKPYKLCDFRPAYGYIFEDYLKGYDFWGYCDTDIIFGDIRKFYSEEVLNKYDKIGIFGHASIIKNSRELRNIFACAGSRYQDVFENPSNATIHGSAFDEEYDGSINSILVKHGYKIYENDICANIYMKSSNFRLTKYRKETNSYVTERNKKAIFVFDNGKLYRYNLDSKTKQDYLYIHMQSRSMRVRANNKNLFKIIPNSFDDVNISNLDKEKFKHFNLHYFRLRSHNLIVKIRRAIAHE